MAALFQPDHVTTASFNFLKLIFSIFTVYILYYMYKVVHRPLLIASDGKFKRLLANMKILNEDYRPTFYGYGKHFQSIGRVLFKSKPPLPYNREIIELWDGGELALDWLENEINNVIYPDREKRPLVFIVPGITGSSDDSYVRHTALQAMNAGCQVVAFNNRGMGGGMKLKTARAYCACNSDDVEFVLKLIVKRYPKSPIIMFAVSMGGMVISHYLLRLKDKVPQQIKAAFIASAPFASELSAQSIERPFVKLLYNRPLANNLCNILERNIEVFKNAEKTLGIDVATALKSKTIREFDESFTSKSFGYADSKDYYKASCLNSKSFRDISVPVLYLNSKDDFFSPVEGIPFENFRSNPNVACVLTEYGGHVGFLEGFDIRKRGYIDRLFSQYIEAVLNEM